MTDPDNDDPEEGAPFAFTFVEEQCLHDAEHPGCRQLVLPCGPHFLEVSTRSLRTVNDAVALTAVHNHITDHGWMLQWLLTWAALYSRYAVLPGQSVESAAQGMGLLEFRDGGLHNEAESEPWQRMMGMLCQQALHRDGAGVIDTITASTELPLNDRLNLVASLLRSAGAMLTVHPDVNQRRLFLYHAFGGALMRHEEFGVIHGLVDMADAVADADAARVQQSVQLVVAGYDDDQQLAAFTLAAQAAGRYMELSEEDGTMPLFVADRTTDDMASSMVPDWADESLDAHRPPEVMTPVWAMRMATAAAQGRTDKMSAWVQDAARQDVVVLGSTYGCLNAIGRRVRMQEQKLADHRSGAAAAPPGHPG